MDPNSEVFSELEKEAIRGLLQMKFLGKRGAPSMLDSLPSAWGAKRLRTFSRLQVDKEREPKTAEETEGTAKVTEEEPCLVSRKTRMPVSNHADKEGEPKGEAPAKLKIRIVRRPPSEIVARAKEAEPVLKRLPPASRGVATVSLAGSPTSPLHGSIFMEPSDSNNSLGPSSTSAVSSPRDRSLVPSHQFKVETKAVVHSSPNSRRPKKKTVVELMQRHKELSTQKEELEKLVLNSKGKEEDQLFLHSFDTSQQTMHSHSRVNHSSSHQAIIPDLNVAFEESSENSSGDFENQLLQRERIVAAAKARKYRLECLRYRQSRFRNFLSKRH